MSFEGARDAYVAGVRDTSRIEPEADTLDVIVRLRGLYSSLAAITHWKLT